MNKEHLLRCASAEWDEAVRKWIIPWVLEGIDLGDDVLEIGPGPGLTTDVLRTCVTRLTAIEVDKALAESLAVRLEGSNVRVLCADATEMPLKTGTYTGAVCLSMLHHVPGAPAQDALFTEAHRVLIPGGVFAGEDSLDTPELRALHNDDIYVPVDPGTLKARLHAAGFHSVDVSTNDYAVRFRATK